MPPSGAALTFKNSTRPSRGEYHLFRSNPLCLTHIPTLALFTTCTPSTIRNNDMPKPKKKDKTPKKKRKMPTAAELNRIGVNSRGEDVFLSEEARRRGMDRQTTDSNNK